MISLLSWDDSSQKLWIDTDSNTWDLLCRYGKHGGIRRTILALRTMTQGKLKWVGWPLKLRHRLGIKHS